MFVKQHVLMGFLLLIAGLSLTLKTVHGGASITPDKERDIEDLYDFMNQYGFTLTKRRALNREMVFISYYFQNPGCVDELAITPLYRNAEGAHIVKQAHKEEPSYIYKGVKYSEFPGIVFWFQQKLSWGKQIIGVPHNPASNVVWSVQGEGSCFLSGPMDWQKFQVASSLQI